MRTHAWSGTVSAVRQAGDSRRHRRVTKFSWYNLGATVYVCLIFTWKLRSWIPVEAPPRVILFPAAAAVTHWRCLCGVWLARTKESLASSQSGPSGPSCFCRRGVDDDDSYCHRIYARLRQSLRDLLQLLMTIQRILLANVAYSISSLYQQMFVQQQEQAKFWARDERREGEGEFDQ